MCQIDLEYMQTSSFSCYCILVVSIQVFTTPTHGQPSVPWNYGHLCENVFSPGKFDQTNVDNAEDFQLSREESDLRFGPSLISEEVDRAIRDWIPEKNRRSTQWAMSIFHALCRVRGVKEKVKVLSAN